MNVRYATTVRTMRRCCFNILSGLSLFVIAAAEALWLQSVLLQFSSRWISNGKGQEVLLKSTKGMAKLQISIPIDLHSPKTIRWKWIGYAVDYHKVPSILMLESSCRTGRRGHVCTTPSPATECYITIDAMISGPMEWLDQYL